MANSIAGVKDGQLIDKDQAITTTREKTVGTSKLDKDAFLQLLVCQMQNQDPLNPSTDTEYVAQLATFSQLEQLQNLSSTSEKSQAFSLVGKNVVLKTTDSNGKTSFVEGPVDFINVSGSKVQLSVKGNLYNQDQIYTVKDDSYVLNQNRPGINNKVSFNYDAKKSEDLTFEVNLGKEGIEADQVAVVLNNQILDNKYYTLDKNKLTIHKEMMEQLPNGEYKPTIIFNDPLSTIVSDKVSIQVKNSTVEKMPDLTAPKKEEGEKSDSTTPNKEEGEKSAED